jgi:hypothetical protein
MRATDCHVPPLATANVLSDQPASKIRSTAGGVILSVQSYLPHNADFRSGLSAFNDGNDTRALAAFVPLTQPQQVATIRNKKHRAATLRRSRGRFFPF